VDSSDGLTGGRASRPPGSGRLAWSPQRTGSAARLHDSALQSTPVQVDVITSTDALEAMVPQWDALWRSCPDSTPFQSAHWLVPWWKHFGSDDLYVVTIREEGLLTAVAPLYIVRDGDDSLGMFLGTGISDYLDMLGDGVADIMRTVCAANCAMWDLHNLPPTSPFIGAATPAGWTDLIEPHDSCARLSLEGAGEDLQYLLSPHARKKIRYYERSVERTGSMRIEPTSPDTLSEHLDALFELHAMRWQSRGLPGVLADDAVQAFHRDVATKLLAASALRMYAMRIDERIVAVFYGFAHGTTVYYYLSGYDPSLSHLSLGHLIVTYAIRDSVRSGMKTFDFLRGSEEYKDSWGAAYRANVRRQLVKAEG
jgi:CelD/BcsL family acetyltransferase involved in cellulose biosynthesis